ncbi:mediator complex subunit 23-domain-containing protein [Coemansia mojavensis]|nr:mediator complex subunit 23-domain-containing protein [Coemansia mojavensis]
MQCIVDLCFGRKRRLGRILLPPDGSWPLISHASRAHTVKHVYDQPGYALVRDSLTLEETQRGASANRVVADLLYQRAPIDEVSASDSGEAERREASMLLLDAMARRTEQIVRFIQSQCDFDTLLDERKLNSNSDATMIVPRNFSYWEYMNEVADQLYYFVLTDTISYIWLLLQLLHIEKVAAGPVQQDLAGDEDMLDQLVQMYNERQIVSRDAFYLRDLSLQATMSHQQGNIRDNHGVKFRHPRIAVAMPFAPVLYQLQNEFGQQFKEENYTLLEGRDTCTVMKTATVSQIRQYVVPNALYTYLVPAREKVQRLQSEATTYLQGGNIGYRLLDYINVGGKHRLLQLIYKMMLAHEQGPQFQFDGRQPSARSGITCVSPHVVDTVYMLLYNAPYSNELMMKEVLEKLRRSDKAMAQGNARFSPANLRWLYTVYQLMNCRLLRFFKYYAHASHLVHHLRHSLINVTHWQLYRSLECFALCLVNLQHDVGFLQALMNPAYHGDAWFECGMLSRNAAVVIARIETMRGLGDVPGLALDDCLDSLSPQPQLWAPAVLRYLPRAVRAYYARRAPQACPRAAPAAIRQLVDARSEHAALLQQTGDAQTEAALTAFYAAREHQALFLCVVWMLCEQQKPLAMAVVRRVLLRFPPAHMSAHTSALVDFIVANENERGLTGPSASTKQLLNDFMFRLQLVHHEHVVFALTRGEHDLRTDQMRLGLTRYVLLESQQFSERLDEWHRLDFQGRYWADFTHWQKQQAYMARFPEYFEFEAAVEGPLEPPPALMPLTTLMNTLFIYFNAPTLHEATVVRSLNRALLDMSQQNFSREFEQFMSGDINDCSHIGAPYVGRIMERIARAISRHLTTADKQNLPEIHYREIPNPILLVLTECQRRKRAAEWPLAKLWLKLTMDPAQRPEPGLYTGAAYIHSTGVLANVLPDELLAFPIIEHLSHIVLQEPILKTISGPKRYFSFVEFARTSRLHADDSGASTQFAATSVFNSFEQNRLHNMANPANTYLTLLHSVLHYGGIATFNTLSDTIHELASGGELCSDIQLLYLCATVGPILYRLVDHNSLYVQILGDLLSILVQICPRISHLDSAFSTDAIEQIMDFICFVKDQFDPGRAAWRRLAPHIAALPTLLKYQLQCVVDQ